MKYKFLAITLRSRLSGYCEFLFGDDGMTKLVNISSKMADCRHLENSLYYRKSVKIIRFPIKFAMHVT